MVHGRRMDGQTDGPESKIQRLVPHLKESIFPIECNSLWDEKKENCKPNSLIKTLDIGQICTIPKFIKQEIGKTIAQLSIWKCGLGILDIDTQLNSLEPQ